MMTLDDWDDAERRIIRAWTNGAVAQALDIVMKRATRLAVGVAAIAVCACTGAPVSPPDPPDPAVLAGTYVLTSKSRDYLLRVMQYATVPEATVTLNVDHSILLANMPDCLDSDTGRSNNRFLNGQGTWSLEKSRRGYGLNMTIDAGTIPHAAYGGPWIHLRGLSAPFELGFRVGDPDSGISLWYTRQPGR